MPMRRPNKVSLIVYAASILLVVLAIANSVRLELNDLSDIVLPALAISMLMITMELILKGVGQVVAALLVHCALLSPVILRVGYVYPLVGILATSPVILIVAIRFPTKIATFINAVFVFGPATIYVFRGGALLDIANLCVMETGTAILCGVFVLHREALVTVTRKLDEEYRSLENLSAANESFVRRLPEIKQESAEEERLRITRELHDSLGYSMTSIAMIMNATQYLYREDPEKVLGYCLKTRDMALESLNDTRQTLYRLRSIAKETPGQPAVFFRRMCCDFQEATGVETKCHTGNLSVILPERVFQTLFRTVQVGLINALRHGKTAKIELFFWVRPEGLSMTIWNSVENLDFDMEQVTEGIGLQGVRERVALLDGEVHMSSRPGEFDLTVFVPEKELTDSDMSHPKRSTSSS